MECPHLYANTISIPSIVEIIMLTQDPSTDSSPPNCDQEAGSALNFRSGKSYKPRATKSKAIVTKLPMRSKSTSSMEIKAILEPLNLPNEYMSEMENTSKRMFEIEYDNARDWEFGLEDLFTEEQIMSIDNMLSYELNKRRGFGRINDEELYREERESDHEEKLYAEAMYGLELLENDPKLRRCFKYLSK